LACASFACEGLRVFSPVPDMRDARDHAHEVEANCRSEPNRPILETLPRSAIDSVQAAYSHVHSSGVDPEARMRGASIHVRPLPGMSKESLGRTLECHQAAVVLGTMAPSVDDPFVLPDSWLDIDVDSDRDGFVVLVRSDEFEAARSVLARTKRFYADGPAPPAPSALRTP
jgi:hypothetical protein